MGRTWQLGRGSLEKAVRGQHAVVGVLGLLTIVAAAAAFGLQNTALAVVALVLALTTAWTVVSALRVRRELMRVEFFAPENRLGEVQAGAETWLPMIKDIAVPGTWMVILALVARRVHIRLRPGKNGRRFDWMIEWGSPTPDTPAVTPEPAAEEAPAGGEQA